MNKTIYLSTPVNSGRGQFDFAYSPANWNLRVNNIFEYKQLLEILDKLTIPVLKFNTNMFIIQIFDSPFTICKILRELPTISITKELNE